jgi:hypothetical protein
MWHQLFNTGTHQLTFIQVCITHPYLCGSTHSGHELIREDPPAAQAFRAAMNDWFARHGF